ncbi:MAG: nitroreductase family deazaflavin-dependent oxidoreductase [Chloroflexi bacterium]|nr:nitroreductase family deazaflavin-dependent oxidoreductase [Chloroflexota bacterium]
MQALRQWLGSIKRSWYPNNRPGPFAQAINRLYAFIASSGIAPNYFVTLEVVGRKSGRIFALPVVIALVDQQRYLVSMLGDDAQWVQNVRAANGKAYIRSGARREVRLEEVPVEQRAPILKAYLKRAPGARPHVSVNKDAPMAEFVAVQAAYPCFRIVTL